MCLPTTLLGFSCCWIWEAALTWETVKSQGPDVRVAAFSMAGRWTSQTDVLLWPFSSKFESSLLKGGTCFKPNHKCILGMLTTHLSHNQCEQISWTSCLYPVLSILSLFFPSFCYNTNPGHIIIPSPYWKQSGYHRTDSPILEFNKQGIFQYVYASQYPRVEQIRGCSPNWPHCVPFLALGC